MPLLPWWSTLYKIPSPFKQTTILIFSTVLIGTQQPLFIHIHIFGDFSPRKKGSLTSIISFGVEKAGRNVVDCLLILWYQFTYSFDEVALLTRWFHWSLILFFLTSSRNTHWPLIIFKGLAKVWFFERFPLGLNRIRLSVFEINLFMNHYV